MENEKEICFSIVLRNGSRYNHSYFVPSNITNEDEIKEYLLLKALGDKVDVEIIE